MTGKSKQEWKENIWTPATARNPERQESFETTSQIEVDVLYTEEDIVNQDYDRDLGYPGSFPFTRGVQPTMYRGRVWTMRQYSGFACAEETNSRYHYLLQQGQTGLSMAFDLPTQIGYDSDNPIAYSEVGKVGVPISHLEDMETVFRGIDMSRISTSMTINATASLLMAYYIATAKRQGVNPRELRGTVQNDILKEYVARGTHIFPAEPSMRLVTDLFAYCASETPNWNNISISGYHMREAGCTAAQEIGFTLANAMAYVQAAVDAGLAVDDFAPQITFFFVAQSNLLEEVAKFRAARRLWARLIKEKFNAQNPRSQMMRFHAQTAGVTLTAQQPDNNVVRSSMQALAAILGGTQSLHVNSKDEALALPTEESVTLSLRTQQVLAFECGLTDTVDPLAGSYYVEHLTDELERAAIKYISHIEEMGGSVRSIEEGYQQREISRAAYKYQQEIEMEQRTVVGVNAFKSSSEETMQTLKIDPQERNRQISRLRQIRASRHQPEVIAALKNLEIVSRSKENTMPAILRCVEAYCTTGEICDVLRSVFGIHREHIIF